MALDVYSRKIVGWSVATYQDARLTVDVLRKVAVRGPCEALIIHSDQGSNYTAKVYQLVCREYRMRQSVGSVADCYDNAMAESWFKTLKSECIRDRKFESLEELKGELSAYIDGFYNARRLHSSIDYQVPNDMEAQYQRANKLGKNN